MTVVLHDLAKSYGRTEALAPTSLRLEPGIVGLLGPSGGGKSTVIRAIAAGDAKRFQAVPGIGKRTAERIIVERPIVETPKGAAIGRPVEAVLGVL